MLHLTLENLFIIAASMWPFDALGFATMKGTEPSRSRSAVQALPPVEEPHPRSNSPCGFEGVSKGVLNEREALGVRRIGRKLVNSRRVQQVVKCPPHGRAHHAKVPI